MKPITVKFDDEEFEQFVEDARKAQLPLSEYIRKLIRKGQTESSEERGGGVTKIDLKTLLVVRNKVTQKTHQTTVIGLRIEDTLPRKKSMVMLPARTVRQHPVYPVVVPKEPPPDRHQGRLARAREVELLNQVFTT